MFSYPILATAAALVALTSVAVSAATLQREPRSHICIRHGLFVDSVTGKPYCPLGVNYYRIGSTEEGKVEHVGLMPGYYDATFIEKMTNDTQAWGFNTIRVFQSYDVGPHGIVTSPDARELNPAYLANVIDLLQRAAAHRIRIIITSDWSPNSHWLASQPLPTEGHYDVPWDTHGAYAENVLHIETALVRTRANLIVQMIAAIRRVNPSLLNVIFAWELENESSYLSSRFPLNQTTGTVRIGEKTYDLSSDQQKQQWMDDITLQWANISADAVHAAEPGALVSESCFGFWDVQRKGPGSMSADDTPDPRVPINPRALVNSHLDYLDLHSYMSFRGNKTSADNTKAALEAEEWDRLKPALRLADKPIIAGEVGFFMHDLQSKIGRSATVTQAGTLLEEHLQVLKHEGFLGTLYWSYGSADSTPNEETPPMRFHPELARSLTDVYGRMTSPPA